MLQDSLDQPPPKLLEGTRGNVRAARSEAGWYPVIVIDLAEV